MFIRVTRGSYDPTREADLQAVIDGQLIPAYKAQAGFGGYYGGFDHATKRVVSVTLWDTAEQANGLRRALGEPILRTLADAGAQLEPGEVYEATARA
jgi:hypothetical protein